MSFWNENTMMTGRTRKTSQKIQTLQMSIRDQNVNILYGKFLKKLQYGQHRLSAISDTKYRIVCNSKGS